MKEKILTQEIVEELGLNKVSVITADILEGYTGITSDAFVDCKSLISITIPDSVKSMGKSVFYGCSSLQSIIIPPGTKQKFARFLPDSRDKLVEHI